MTLRYILAPGTNPYENLALESLLIDEVKEDECILYLWQNHKTVVIGRNQNAWSECKVQALEDDGGYLARRYSGGGAVFHDLGNLNFSFIAHRYNYDVERQLEVLLKALPLLGIQGEKSGRNDVSIEGRKFSGNAFSQRGDHLCHHGTIMIRVNKDMLGKYLNVSPQKLKSKGVSSVKSRVCNLADYIPHITVDQVSHALLAAFKTLYGGEPAPISLDQLNPAVLNAEKEKLASWEWKYGREIPFTLEMEHRFPWGSLSLKFQINKGIIEDTLAYSDALNTGFAGSLPDILLGCRYSAPDIWEKLASLWPEDPELRGMARELGEWLIQSMEGNENLYERTI